MQDILSWFGNSKTEEYYACEDGQRSLDQFVLCEEEGTAVGTGFFWVNQLGDEYYHLFTEDTDSKTGEGKQDK